MRSEASALEPELPDKQIPEGSAVVGRAGDVTAHEGLHRAGIENPLPLEAVGGEHVFHERPEAAAQPGGHGNLEAALAAPQDFLRLFALSVRILMICPRLLES